MAQYADSVGKPNISKKGKTPKGRKKKEGIVPAGGSSVLSLLESSPIPVRFRFDSSRERERIQHNSSASRYQTLNPSTTTRETNKYIFCHRSWTTPFPVIFRHYPHGPGNAAASASIFEKKNIFKKKRGRGKEKNTAKYPAHFVLYESFPVLVPETIHRQ